MKAKEISKDIYDVDAWIDEGIGVVGTRKREKAEELALAEFNAELLREARLKANISQTELAKLIGKDKAYVSRIERGVIVPSVNTFARIASALGFMVTLKPIY